MTLWTKTLIGAWMALFLVSCQDSVLAFDPQSIMTISFEVPNK